jgi:hypothetical protein
MRCDAMRCDGAACSAATRGAAASRTPSAKAGVKLAAAGDVVKPPRYAPDTIGCEHGGDSSRRSSDTGRVFAHPCCPAIASGGMCASHSIASAAASAAAAPPLPL